MREMLHGEKTEEVQCSIETVLNCYNYKSMRLKCAVKKGPRSFACFVYFNYYFCQLRSSCYSIPESCPAVLVMTDQQPYSDKDSHSEIKERLISLHIGSNCTIHLTHLGPSPFRGAKGSGWALMSVAEMGLFGPSLGKSDMALQNCTFPSNSPQKSANLFKLELSTRNITVIDMLTKLLLTQA